VRCGCSQAQFWDSSRPECVADDGKVAGISHRIALRRLGDLADVPLPYVGLFSD
jgi:hypothetical protein